MPTVLQPASKSADYRRDGQAWLDAQIELLREGRLDELDRVNLIEELEDMGRRQRQAVASNLVVVLTHLLKYRYQPEQRSNSWRASIREHRRRLRRDFQDSPSLRQYAATVFAECHQDARELAADETGLDEQTFPPDAPFTLEQTLDRTYLPD